MKSVSFIVSVLFGTALAATPKGVLSLDAITFDKVVDGSRNVLVKFDKKYAYGDEQNEWEKLATALPHSDILLAEVGTTEYSDTENGQLLTRFSVDKDSKEGLPQFRLFLKNGDISNPLVYKDGITNNDLQRFVKANGIYVGLEGCMKEFDTLALAFIESDDSSTRDAIGKKGKQLLAQLSTNETKHKWAKYYMKVMNKIRNDSGYVRKESNRLGNLLNSNTAKLKKEQSQWFRTRLNILSSFVALPDDADTSKSEL